MKNNRKYTVSKNRTDYHHLVGRIVGVRILDAGMQGAETQGAGMQVPVRITDEYPNFLLGTVLPHQNPDGYGLSHSYPITISKNDLMTGRTVISTVLSTAANTVQAEKEKEQPMSLRELKNQLRATEDYEKNHAKKKPSRKKLLETSTPVVACRIGTMILTVFSNGFVLAECDGHYSAIRIDDCGDYKYSSSCGSVCGSSYDYRGMDPATPLSFGEDFFLDEPWPLRMMLQAEDQLTVVADRRSERLLSKHPEIPDSVNWLRGRTRSPEDDLVWRMDLENAKRLLTEKQRRAFELYFEEGYTMQEIGEMENLTQAGVWKRLKEGIRKIKQYMNEN